MFGPQLRGVGQRLVAALKNPHVVEWVKIGGLLIGGAFAVWKFWWQDYYVPTHVRPTVNLTATVAEQAERRGLIPIAASISVSNTSRTPLYVLQSDVRVDGVAVAAGSRPVDSTLTKPPGDGDHFFASAQPAVLLCTGSPFAAASWFEPAQTASTTMLCYAPSGRFDHVRLVAHVRVARDTANVRALMRRGADGAWEPRRQVLLDDQWVDFDEKNARHVEIRDAAEVRSFEVEHVLALGSR
jgi:hypothetical protein